MSDQLIITTGPVALLDVSRICGSRQQTHTETHQLCYVAVLFKSHKFSADGDCTTIGIATVSYLQLRQSTGVAPSQPQQKAILTCMMWTVVLRTAIERASAPGRRSLSEVSSHIMVEITNVGLVLSM